MRYRIEPHALHARIRGKLLFLLAWPTLLLAMRRRRPTELWIGDSHAMSFNRKITNSMFMRAQDGRLILRAGARLMYSVSRTGLPPEVLRVARLVNRFGRPGSLVPVFSAGEIDVRVHLASRADEPFDFVAGYVDRCLEVAELLKARTVGFVVPPPPVEIPEDHVWFPINGTIQVRVAVHTKLRKALAEAIADRPGTVLLDFTDVLAGPSGAMPLDLTSDGAHTNLVAVERIRARIDEDRLLRPEGRAGQADFRQ